MRAGRHFRPKPRGSWVMTVITDKVVLYYDSANTVYRFSPILTTKDVAIFWRAHQGGENAARVRLSNTQPYVLSTTSMMEMALQESIPIDH